MKSQSKWGRIGMILVILLVFYIVIFVVFESIHTYGEGVWLPAYLNPVLIALSLTVGYFASMILNLVKRRFITAGIVMISWGLFSYWFRINNNDYQYLGIALISIGLVIMASPLLLQRRLPA
jgi:hypothetical protein